jgi:pyruvate/2-oxoglutarate dehydrogenase complex dihydrolipoamide dehydrogenase (E3) component
LPELTSTAVKMGNALGRRLAHRVKNVEFSNHLMFSDLSNYPTTIFTPLEYSSCGLGEEKAI